MSNSKCFGFLILIITANIVFHSCSTFPEPNEINDTMLIGKIIQNGINYDSFNGASVNGKHTSDIEITVKNLSTNEITKLKSYYGGMFSTIRLPEGNYEISILYLKVVNGNSYANVFSNLANVKYFSIINGSVNNLGLIEWNCDNNEGYNILLNRNYINVKEDFNKRNDKSSWNNIKWVNVDVHK